jgi:hypothetical protein
MKNAIRSPEHTRNTHEGAPETRNFLLSDLELDELQVKYEKIKAACDDVNE